MSSSKATTLQQDRNREIAITILNQLGYHRFIAMTGADELTAIPNGLRFHVPGRTKNRINWCEIILTPSDEYDMVFYSTATGKLKRVRSFEGVYWEQLEELLTAATGLATRL